MKALLMPFAPGLVHPLLQQLHLIRVLRPIGIPLRGRPVIILAAAAIHNQRSCCCDFNGEELSVE
jgi:hypothetical protein